MDHFDILKRAFNITWRFRALWAFGFFLALCGGGGGGGGGNFNFNPGFGGPSEGDLGELEGLGQVVQWIEENPEVIVAIIVGFICLILLMTVVGIVVRAVTRTSLIAMVQQIEAGQPVSVAEGFRLGWSNAAWRVFLAGLAVGIPQFILGLVLVLVIALPIVLALVSEEPALIGMGAVLSILTCLVVLPLLIVLSVILGPFLELTWRRTVLDRRGVLDSLKDAFRLMANNKLNVFIIWLLLFAIGIGWAIASLLILLPVALLAGLIIGGIPAGLVYLLSESWVGALIAGGPLALLALIVVFSLGGGLLLVYSSTVWTLTHLNLTRPRLDPMPLPPAAPPGDGGEGEDTLLHLPSPDPQPSS
jgi:hypothetical protein